MTTNEPVRVGIVGTSWWTDAMYLPALKQHPQAAVIAISGRNEKNARKIAERWQIPQVYTDYGAMIDQGGLNAIVIASTNDTHHPITMKALDAGLHVLCEKPLALTYAAAMEMAERAEQAGVKHHVPFTYSYMPTARYLKELIEDGYIGKPYHLNLRYYTGYGRGGAYHWRFDVSKSGAGAIGDIGSHFLYLAQRFYGEIVAVCCQLAHNVPRAPAPDGKPYTQGDDAAIVMLQFANGAQGAIHVTTVAYEDTPFGQTHHMEFHGSGGTLYSFTDWDTIQRVSGARQGEGAIRELPIPEHIWAGARHDTVHNTYRDIFREQDLMAREFITAIVEDKPIRPDFHDGARIQRLIEACVESHRRRCWMNVKSIT